MPPPPSLALQISPWTVGVSLLCLLLTFAPRLRRPAVTVLNALIVLQIAILAVVPVHRGCLPGAALVPVLAAKSALLALTLARLCALRRLRFGLGQALASAAVAVAYLAAVDERRVYACDRITARTLGVSALLSVLAYAAAWGALAARCGCAPPP